MVDVKISALGAISAVAGEDLVAIIDNPGVTPVSKKATIDQIKTYIGGMTASSTATFTNKTFDADGTGNSITNIENADIKAAAAIDATKIADGSVTSAEFQYINSLSSNAQTQINAKQATLTFGIANTNAVDIDSASVANAEYAKFTTNGLESKSFSEVKTDLSLNNVENTAISTFTGSSNIATVGTIASGTWQGTAIAQAYIGADAINGTKIEDNAIANEHLADDSVGIAELSATGSSISTKFLRGDNTWQTVTTSPAFNDLSDVTLTSPVQGHILYRNASGWVNLAPGTSGFFLKTLGAGANPVWATGGGGNHTEQGFDVYTTHTPTASTSDGIGYMFARKIDSNNDGLYITLWKNGASQEVQIA